MFKPQPFPPFPDSASRPQRHTGNRSPSPLEYADPDQGDYPDDEALPYQHRRYADNELTCLPGGAEEVLQAFCKPDSGVELPQALEDLINIFGPGTQEWHV